MNLISMDYLGIESSVLSQQYNIYYRYYTHKLLVYWNSHLTTSKNGIQYNILILLKEEISEFSPLYYQCLNNSNTQILFTSSTLKYH